MREDSQEGEESREEELGRKPCHLPEDAWTADHHTMQNEPHRKTSLLSHVDAQKDQFERRELSQRKGPRTRKYHL